MEEKNYNQEFARTTNVMDFKIRMEGEVPEGYPTVQPEDAYCASCFEPDYGKRKEAFVDFALASPSTDTAKGFFYELVRIDRNHGPVNEHALYGALEYIGMRKDCSDFVMMGIQRLWYQLKDHELVSPELRQACRQAILDFKYWPDEPGIDSMCYWTENHHIIFSVCEYLAGQAFPEEVFTNSGHTGKQKMERARRRIDKWLELRFRTGFSEWLSNVYFDESMPPMINLFDLAEDQGLRKGAGQIIDLMLLDMALNSYKGIFSCTHGRTYTMEKTRPLMEDTIDTAKLAFGLGKFTNKNNMATPLLALSGYEPPQVVVDIANDPSVLENRQRVSIRFKDARRWGYHKLDTESALGLLSFGGYTHARTFNHLALMLEEFRWWDNQFFKELQPFKKLVRVGRHIGLTNLVAWVFRKDMSRNAMTEAMLYTYRTPHYMLSTAQDYRKSYGGDQHHIWQATLDNEAVLFTTHPGGYGESAPDAYWHGNGFMPRSMQYRNVNISIYNTPSGPTPILERILDFTHAFFPRERFDEVREEGGWVFGRSGKGYAALYSRNGYRWETKGEWAGSEVIAQGKKNVWITELGSEEESGSFDNFVEQICSAALSFRGLKLRYQSPSLGLMQAGWRGAMKVKGRPVPLKAYKRYDNPHSRTDFDKDEIRVQHGDQGMHLKLG